MGLEKQLAASRSQAIEDIKSEVSTCYLNLEEKVLTYCQHANKALSLNRLSL